MKPILSLLIMLLCFSAAFTQTIHQAVPDTCTDANTYLSTEYPVRLENDQEELRISVQQDLVLYPEDKDVVAKYTYMFTIDCKGRNIGSMLKNSEGPSGGLTIRIKKLLDSKCTWKPAIHHEQPVTSFYYLTIIFNRGNIDVVKQKPGK